MELKEVKSCISGQSIAFLWKPSLLAKKYDLGTYHITKENLVI